MRQFIRRGSKNRLATLLTNSIFLSIGVLALVTVFQNYTVNKDVVSQEIARTKTQTQSLVQEIFNLKVRSLEIQQDSHTRNEILVESISNRKSHDLDRLFDSIDQASPNLAPDFRFIVANDELIWDDANYQFYGISHKQIQHLSYDMARSNDWYISQTPSTMGTRYLMMRCTTIINFATGEVVGYLYIGVVLNDNFSLVNTISRGSNADEILLAVGTQIIASSTRNQDVHHIEWLEQSSRSFNDSRFMVARTDLTIANVPTFLSVYTIQSNEHIVDFVQSHYRWIAITTLLIILIALYTRFWMGRRISKELKTLVEYTDSAIKAQRVTQFPGSTIEEFGQIGRSFERSFDRLQEQEKQFADLFNFSLTPITLWNESGQLEEMNPSAERCFVDMTAKQHLVESLAPHIQMCAQGATLTGINTTIANKTFRWNLSPIVGDSAAMQIMAQGQDITSFIEAERQSESAREEAEESARVRADFLAKMSHELRTPLNGILGVSQLLKDKMSNPQDLDHMEVLCNSGEHLLAVLNDILDFSKIEQGKFNIQSSPFRLAELSNAVEKIFTPLCDDKGVKFVVSSNVNSQAIAYSDQIRLNQILFNLISNAVKFTHTGQVEVRIEIGEYEQQTNLVIQVTDSGIGIEQSRLEHIFEPFVQAEETTTREYGGSGLGLAIVRSLVSLMDGTISVSSETNVGTQFDVVIPIGISDDEELHEKSQALHDPKTLFDHSIHVLLVEDNHTNAFIAKAFCEKYGMTVTWVKDGMNAIEYMKHNNDVELILMDNQLPSLGGIEATEILRKELESDVPIFACTADGMKETRRAFLNAGADYVIIKPIKERALNTAFVYYKEKFIDSINVKQ